MKLSLTISMGFNRVGCLPEIITLSWLDDGVGTEAIFRQHKAKWHDSFVNCNSTILRQHLSEQRRGNLTLKTIKMFIRRFPVSL